MNLKVTIRDGNYLDKKVIVITDLPIEGTDKFFLRFLLEK